MLRLAKGYLLFPIALLLYPVLLSLIPRGVNYPFRVFYRDMLDEKKTRD